MKNQIFLVTRSHAAAEMSSLCSMARSILMLLVAALLLSSVALLVEGKSAKVPGKVFIDLIKNDTSINGAAIRVANIESQGKSVFVSRSSSFDRVLFVNI